MVDKPQVADDKNMRNESRIASSHAITNEKDNQIAMAMASGHKDSTPSSCTSMEIDDSQATFKSDNKGHPSEITFKSTLAGDSPTVLSDIKYKGEGNEVSSFTTFYKHPVIGDMHHKYEQNKDGAWNDFRQDEKGNWVTAKNPITDQPQDDLGRVTINTDAKTGKVEVHATGLEARNIGEFVIDEGFMSKHALERHDSVSEKMCAFQTIDDLAKNHDGSLSLTKLQDLLTKEKAGESNLEIITGYEQLIADFDKLAKGKTEIAEGDLGKCANEVRDNAIATAITSIMANGDRVSYSDHLLIEKFFDKASPFLLLKSEEAKVVQEGINRQLKSLGGAAGNYSIRFGDNLVDRIPTDAPSFGFASAPKDRILEILNQSKPVGQVRIATRTDLIEVK